MTATAPRISYRSTDRGLENSTRSKTFLRSIIDFSIKPNIQFSKAIPFSLLPQSILPVNP
jgi:hypothetical protein